ncbi:MAG: DUF3426 domain-containing protein [Telluria sp.]|nr:DUF3426 domain-containing protein [Telluria sp.]
MAFATRCPHCDTAFRVASDQLKLRGGIVRCGACNEVFDGNATLVDLDAVVAQEASAPPEPSEASGSAAFDGEIAALEAEPAAGSEPVYTLEFDTALDPFGILPTPAPSEPQADADEQAEPAIDATMAPDLEPQADEPEPDADADMAADASADTDADSSGVDIDGDAASTSFPRTREPNFSDAGDTADITESAPEDPLEAPDEAAGATVEQDLSPEPEPEPQPEPLPQRASAAGQQASVPKAPPPEPEMDEPEFVRRSRRQEKASRNRRILMSVGSLLLLATLLVQGVTTFRNVLAAQFPQLTPALGSACALLGCRVELPSQIEALSVETGELQALGADTFSLTTLLRNQSRLVQAWPSLELALTDANDKPLLRRVFSPAEYLPPAIAPAKGFAARSEQPVKLHFELKQLKASGYRIAIFYP